MAARSRIHLVLSGELNFPLMKLRRAICACRKETAFDYEEKLMNMGVWPLDTALKRYTIAEVLDKLTDFEFTPRTNMCGPQGCLRDYKRSIDIAIRRANQDFDGLCLDCMKRSTPTFDEPMEDYIEKNSPHRGRWDVNCRFKHKRSTWFFSWMGTPDGRRRVLSAVDIEEEHRRSMGSGRKGRRVRTGTRRNSAKPYTNTNTNMNGLTFVNPSTGDSDKENLDSFYNDVVDDDEFFDAREDADDLDGVAADGELDN
ncbi:hypothetical protein K469DRAFT_709139 [Zopfia rhizophila CBS 207.26]|uniref:Uncharacterized protein n=1 Tax=Zopfia rhizophila CBS 207.26 TaxID=1314779 RepID=A0A6A6DXH7_9PEZI|nr:hypothetical protein K469DRAFT_709139 [Zopfia rhizophila CBS 207.26]